MSRGDGFSIVKQQGRSKYRIQFREDVQGKRVHPGFRDKAATIAHARQLWADHERAKAGLPGYTDKPIEYLSWAVFRERFSTHYLTGLRPATRETYDSVFDVLEKEMHPILLKEIDSQFLTNFVTNLRDRPIIRRGTPTKKVGLEPSSIRQYLVNLHTALKWAVDNRYLPAIPAFPKVKVPKRKPKPIDPRDFAKLLAVAPSELWRAYLLCGWLGGLRLSEAAQLRRQPTEEQPWLDLPGDRIWLPAKFTKVAEDQWIPLHPDLRRALEALPDTGDQIFAFKSRRGGRLTRAGYSQTVLNLAAKAGVKLSMHRLRKGFGCRVAQQLGKGNAPVLHRLMRHRTMQMTMDYYANVDDILAESIRQLDQTEKPISTATSTNSHPDAPQSQGADGTTPTDKPASDQPPGTEFL
jgi:integrase